jgi:hypothetical protein
MNTEEKTLVERLREGYEKAKKPLAFILAFTAIALTTLPEEVLPPRLGQGANTAALLALALILMEILFEVYEKVVLEPTGVNVINSNDPYREVRKIVENERKVSIQYMGVAGRHGWQNVLAKLLAEGGSESLLDSVEFDVEVALIHPERCEPDDPIFGRFDMASSIDRQIRRRAEAVEEVTGGGSRLSLYHYDHMPNMIGMLINDNYLYLTYCYWEERREGMVLRAGGSEYFVYDKGDQFGGQECITRFQGWFEYIRRGSGQAPAGN